MRPTSSLNPISALRLAGLVALCSVVVVAGTSAAPGPHLSWDRCWGDGQVANKVFACNTNTGAEVLVISYESPVAVSGITGVEAELGIFYTGFIPPSGVTFPAWWEVFGSGRCRSTASAVILAGAPTSLCVDPYQGLAQGGLAALRVDTQPTSTGSARLSMGVAVPPQTS